MELTVQKNLEETISTYPILFPFVETKETAIFLLVQENLFLGLVSLAQAQKAALFGQRQLILVHTKTDLCPVGVQVGLARP